MEKVSHSVSVTDHSLPLITDTQYLENFTSNSLNRKFFGIVHRGVFRGFECLAAGGHKIKITSKDPDNATRKGVAVVERDDYLLTVHQQEDIVIDANTLIDGYIVLEAFYQFGVITKQVDLSSNVEAAQIKFIPIDALEEHHIILCRVTLPEGQAEITQDCISVDERYYGGTDLAQHLNTPDPHPQYLLRKEAATSAEIESKSPLAKFPLLPQLWQALDNSLQSIDIAVNGDAALSATGNALSGLTIAIRAANLTQSGVVTLSNDYETGAENLAATTYSVQMAVQYLLQTCNELVAQSEENATSYTDQEINALKGDGSGGLNLKSLSDAIVSNDGDINRLTLDLADTVQSVSETLARAVAAEQNAKSYADSLIQSLLGDSPAEHLNTIKELGEALTNNGDGIAAINSELATKASKSIQVIVTGALTGGGTLGSNISLGVKDATTGQKGVVQLGSATNSTSETIAATLKAVKSAYDLAASKITQAQADERYLGKLATAEKAKILETARTINGTSFNGAGNITTASWGTSRTLTIGNTGKSVNGAGNVAWSLAEIGAVPAADVSQIASFAGMLNKIPKVGHTGVMEVARYIDFHTTNSTADYDVRLDCNGSSELSVIGGSLSVESLNMQSSRDPSKKSSVRIWNGGDARGHVYEASTPVGSYYFYFQATDAGVKSFALNGNGAVGGTLGVSNFIQINPVGSTAPVKPLVHAYVGDQYGDAIHVNANGGAAYITSGEHDIANLKSISAANSEDILISANGSVKILTGTNAWTSRKQFTFNNAGSLYVPHNLHLGSHSDYPYIGQMDASEKDLRIQTPDGYFRVGPRNSSYCHFDTDKPKFYSYKPFEFASTINTLGNILMDGKIAFKGDDTWLRINDTGAFTSGTYFGNTLVRTDGSFTVGSWSANTGSSKLDQPSGVSWGADGVPALESTYDNNSSASYVWGATTDAGTLKAGMQIYNDANCSNMRLYWNNRTRYINYDSAGNLTGPANVAGYSDKRVKTDIKTIPNALDKIKQLNGVTYLRTDNPDTIDLRQTGLIAQDVEKVLPEAVITSENEQAGIKDFKSVAYGNLAGLFVEAFKAQQSQIETQDKVIKALEKRLQALEGASNE